MGDNYHLRLVKDHRLCWSLKDRRRTFEENFAWKIFTRPTFLPVCLQWIKAQNTFLVAIGQCRQTWFDFENIQKIQFHKTQKVWSETFLNKFFLINSLKQKILRD